MEEVADVRRIISDDAKLFADPFVCELSQCLGCFYTTSVEGEVLGVLAIVKQFLRLMRRLAADSDAGQAQHVHLAIGFRHKKVWDRGVAASFGRGKVKRSASVGTGSPCFEPCASL